MGIEEAILGLLFLEFQCKFEKHNDIDGNEFDSRFECFRDNDIIEITCKCRVSGDVHSEKFENVLVSINDCACNIKAYDFELTWLPWVQIENKLTEKIKHYLK